MLHGLWLRLGPVSRYPDLMLADVVVAGGLVGLLVIILIVLLIIYLIRRV